MFKKYFRPSCQFSYNERSRRFGLVQGFYNLVSHSGSFYQILMELLVCTINFGSLSKSVQTSRWLVRLHKSEYVTNILAGDGGDKPLKGPGYFTKSPC